MSGAVKKPARTAASKAVEPPSRGEAAWLAAKAEIARRNDAARARAAADGAVIAARRAEERRAVERLEAADRPQQPRPASAVLGHLTPGSPAPAGSGLRDRPRL